MYRIEIPVPQGQVTFQPRTLGEVGADILALKIAIGLVLPPNTQRNIDLLVSTQEALTNSNYTPKVSQDKNSWFDCVEGTNIDIQRAATFDIRTKNAITKFQLDNMFMIFYYYFETQIVRRILLGSATGIIENSDNFEKYEKLVEFNYYQIPKLFDAEFGLLGEATLAVMHGWRPGKILAPRGYVHPETFDQFDEVVSIIPEIFYTDFFNKQDFSYPALINQGILLSVPMQTTKKMFYDFLNSASSYRNWIKLREQSQNMHELNSSYNENDPAAFSRPMKLKTLIFPKEQDTTSVLYAFSSFAAAAISDLDELEQSKVSTMPYEEAVQQSRDKFKEFFRPDPFSTTSPFEIDENTIGFYYKTKFLLSPNGPFPDESEDAIRELEDRALQQVLDFYRKPKIWNLFLQGEEVEKIREHYFGFSDGIPAPGHSGALPQGPIEENRLKTVKGFLDLKEKIRTEEEEIKRVESTLEPRIDHMYPPQGHWYQPQAQFGEPADQPLPENVVIQRFKESRNNFIIFKKEKIKEYKQKIEEIKNLSKADNYYVLATDVVLQNLNTDNIYANSWRTIESGRVKPLIKFEEFITPTLRPGQAYRAYFKINKHKLNMISYGSSPMRSSQLSTESYSLESLEPCYYKTTEQELRVYEEYRLHAQKRRRELTRRLRSGLEEGIFEEEEDKLENPKIELGPFGPFDVGASISSIDGFNNVRTDREFTRKAIYTLKDKLTSLSDTLNFSDTDFEDFNQLIEESESNLHGGSGQKKKNQKKAKNELKITLKELKQRIDKAGEDIQTSYEILLRENIALEPRSAFDGPSEVAKLNLFYTQLVSFLDQNVTSDFLEKTNDAMKIEKKSEKIENVSGQDPGDVDLWFKFEPTQYTDLGPKNGKNIVSIVVAIDTKVFKAAPKSDNLARQGNLDFFSTMSRPRTVNYVSSIISMTSPFSTEEYSVSVSKIIGSYFDGVLSFCSEMGLDGEKHAAISQIGTFTSGIRVRIPESESLGEGFVSWFDTYFSDPLSQWASSSAENARQTMNSDFDPSRALKMLGKTCTIEKIYEEFADRFDARMLICNYLECMKIPAFSLTLPSFTLPPWPRIPVIGIYWAMLKFIFKNFIQIITRILCTMARTLIDKLAFPMCQEQLEDFIAAGSSALPALGRALGSAFTRTGLYMNPEEEEEVKETTENAKQFFDDVSKVVTGTELCHLLEGRLLDSSAMTMLETLAQNNNLSKQLDSDESIVNFFGVLGPYVPAQVCKQLAQVKTQLGASCDDENDSLKSIRNRLLNGEGLQQIDEEGRVVSRPSLTPEQVKKVMAIAENNLQKQKDTIRSLSNNTLMDLIPEDLKPGSKHKIVSSLPPELKSSLQLSVAGIFQSSRISYVTALSSYIPSIMVSTYDALKPGEPGYPDESYLRLESALERIKNFSIATQKSRFIHPIDNSYSYAGDYTIVGTPENSSLHNARTRISPKEVACLYEVYETEKVKLPDGLTTPAGRNYHIVHKRFKPTKITGVVQTSYDSDGRWTKNRLLTVIDNYNRRDKEQLGLKYYKPETYIKMVRPDPLDEDYEEINYPAEVTFNVGVNLLEGTPLGDRARQLPLGGDADFRPFDRYWITTFDTSPDSPQTKLDTEFILRPIRVNAFTNNSPFRFPLPPSGFGFTNQRISSSIAFKDTRISTGGENATPDDEAAQRKLEEVITERMEFAVTQEDVISKNKVTFPSIRFSDSVVKALGGTGYEFYDSLTTLDFESVATSQYPDLQSDLCGLRAMWPNWHQSGNQYRKVFDFPVLGPLSWWLPVDTPVQKRAFQNDGSWTTSTRSFPTGGHLIGPGRQSYMVRALPGGRAGSFYNFSEDEWQRWITLNEPKFHDAAWHMIKGAYDCRNLTFEDGFSPPITSEGVAITFGVFNFEDHFPQYKAPIRGNFARKGIHTKSPFFNDDFFMSDKDHFYEDSEKSLYDRYPGIDQKSNVYSDSIARLAADPNFGGWSLKKEILENLNSTLSTAMGANTSSKIIISSPLNTEDLRSRGLLPNFIDEFLEDPQNYKGVDWPEKWGNLKTQTYQYWDTMLIDPEGDGIRRGAFKPLSFPVGHYYYSNANKDLSLQGLRGPIINGEAYKYFPNTCAPYGEVMYWVTDYYHEEYAINNPKLLEIVQNRLNQLSGIVIEELENIQNQASEKLMPMIKKIMRNTLAKNSSRLGNVNYTCINPPGVVGQPDYRELEPADLLNISFRAGPYQPTLKLVEFATHDRKLDAYNIVIDQDRMLAQGSNPLLDKGSKYKSTESVRTLNGVSTSTREIFKFCDTLPEEVVENNTSMFKMKNGEDFSRREAYSEIILSSLDKYFENSEAEKQQSRQFLKLGLKSLNFKSSTETIVSNLLENLAHSSLFTNNYAKRRGKDLSAKPNMVPGTKCLRNRYGLTSGSLLNFEETLLQDAISVIESELTKPEFSPFKRNFNAQDPIQSAMKKIALKMFVKVCLLDLMFKGGLSNATWGLEPIVSEPVFQKYAIEHVAKELDKNSKLRDSWGEIIEDLVGITNKRSSLEKFVLEILMEFPALSRSVFNPGLGHIDFYNWQNLSRVVEFSEQTDLPVEQSRRVNNFYKNFGLFKRFPVTHSRKLEEVIYTDIFSDQYDEFAAWNQRWIFGVAGAPEKFPKKQKKLKFVRLKGYRSHSSPGRDNYESFNSFDLNKTRPGTISSLDKNIINHTAVNEFILEDYVRVFGEILKPRSAPGLSTENDGTIITTEDRPTESESERLSREAREEAEREAARRREEGNYIGELSDPRGWNAHGVVMSKQEFYFMMRRLWGSLSERGEYEEYYKIIENSQFYQGTRLVQLFLKKVNRARRNIVQADGSTSLGLVFEPELINVLTNEGPGQNLSNLQFESVDEILNRYDATEKVIKHVIENPLIGRLAERERSFLYIADVEESERKRDSEGAPVATTRQPLLMGVGIPIVSHEKPIDINSCKEEIFGPLDPHSPEYLNQRNTIEGLDLMVTDLSNTKQYKALMEHIFPLKRYMAISSISTTAMMAGYSDLPGLFESTKSMLSHVVALSRMSPQEMMSSGAVNLILSSGVIDLADFANKQGPNVPADPDDPNCFEFPKLTEDFWKNFYKEMKRLMKYTPAIILRGLANNLDPAYKEMRAHYLNCDLKEIGWGGIHYETLKYKTPVGMMYEKDQSAGNKEGKYAPIFPTGIKDFFHSFYYLFTEPEYLGMTTAKILSYAISGPLPFIDLTTAFKVPCAEINSAWREGEKYDLGTYGRYGHPLTPLTAMALSTYQLPADIEKRDSNCPDEITGTPDSEASENECDDVE